jgi:hypothetical protein
MLRLPLAIRGACPREIASSSSPRQPVAMRSSTLNPSTQPLLRAAWPK